MKRLSIPVSHPLPYGKAGHIGRFGTYGTAWDKVGHQAIHIQGVPPVPAIPPGTGQESGTLGTTDNDMTDNSMNE